MVRGQEAKNYITSTILSSFEGSFIHEKELRVPVKESSGEIVQIKIALTAAKTNVDSPAAGVYSNMNSSSDTTTGESADTPSEDVLLCLSRLIKELG